MKPIAIVLIVTGVAVTVLGGWASLVVPIRTKEIRLQKSAIDWSVETFRLTMWGRATYHHMYRKFDPSELKLGEVVVQSYDEYIEEGGLDWSGHQHGPWIQRFHIAGGWKVYTRWHRNGRTVTREEWETGE